MTTYLIGVAILGIMVFAIYRWGGASQRRKNVEKRLEAIKDDHEKLDAVKPSGRSDTSKRLQDGEF